MPEAQPNPSPNSAIYNFIKAACQMIRLVIPPERHFAIVVWTQPRGPLGGQELVYETTDQDNRSAARALHTLANWLDPPAKA
jgi:hypothetical protein